MSKFPEFMPLASGDESFFKACIEPLRGVSSFPVILERDSRLEEVSSSFSALIWSVIGPVLWALIFCGVTTYS